MELGIGHGSTMLLRHAALKPSSMQQYCDRAAAYSRRVGKPDNHTGLTSQKIDNTLNNSKHHHRHRRDLNSFATPGSLFGAFGAVKPLRKRRASDSHRKKPDSKHKVHICVSSPSSAQHQGCGAKVVPDGTEAQYPSPLTCDGWASWSVPLEDVCPSPTLILQKLRHARVVLLQASNNLLDRH